MTDPIVFIGSFRARPGRGADFRRMFEEVVDLIGSAKPATALYAGYADADGSTIRVVHAFPDAPAIARHFEGSQDRSASVADIIEPTGFALYGPAPDAVVEQLHAEAAAAGVNFENLPASLGGFLRSPPA